MMTDALTHSDPTMTSERFGVDISDHLELACVCVAPAAPRGVVHIFHGMGEHKERYLPFMGVLSDHGYAAVAHDHRRHGKSGTDRDGPGVFIDEDTWDRVIHDAYQAVRASKERYPGLDLCILGHSMGSVILRRLLFTFPDAADRAIVMGTLPPYGTVAGWGPLTLAKMVHRVTSSRRCSAFLSQALNRPLLKGIQNPRTPFDWLTHDETVIDAYQADPYCGYAYTPRFYVEFFKGIVNLHHRDRIRRGENIPMLFISGREDPVGKFGKGVERVARCYEQAGFTRVAIELIPHARHEVLNEHNRDTTYQTILNWLSPPD